MSQEKFLKGDIVEILKQYQDIGDDELIWVAIDDEEKGRVTVTPINSTLSIKPTYVMNSDWLKLKKRGGGE
jgi:imidazole glycerol phosphate synthase subunit HisF